MKEYRESVVIANTFLAVVVILLGCVGFSFLKIKSDWYAGVYGCVLLPIWIVFGVIGFSEILFSEGVTEAVDEQCKNILDEVPPIYFEDDSSDPYEIKIGLDVYQQIGIDRYMCSSSCPCP